MLPSDEENSRCWDYVMKFSMDEIQANGNSNLNQLCSKYIESKKSFLHYVQDKRRAIQQDKKGSGSAPILARNFIHFSPSFPTKDS
jgi:hypothetical protein